VPSILSDDRAYTTGRLRMRFRADVCLAILLLLTVFSTCPTAHAARISAPGLHAKAAAADDTVSPVWPTDPVSCDLLLEGDIADGDAAALEREFNTIVGSWHAFSFFLCLRSDGGSVPEALKIARFVLETQRPSIATVVEDGKTCASACALIFLAGNAPAARGALPQRFLHPRGKLQFHSSRLDLSKYKDDMQLLEYLNTSTFEGRGLREKIVDLYRDGLRDEQSVISTFQRFIHQREDLGDPWVRPSLFLELFAQDPSELICVDTVDAVGRWNIQVYGYDPPKSLTKKHYYNVCRNAYNWRSDRFVADDELEEDDELELKKPLLSTKIGERNKASEFFDDRYVMPYQGAMLQLSCVIEITYKYRKDEKKKLDAETQLTVFFTSGGGNRSNLGPTSYFSASTLLPDLPRVRRPRIDATNARSASDFRNYANSLMNGCSYKSLPNLDEATCQSKCSVDAACVAYSHSKVTHACELKHTLTARRFDPTWTTGEPSAGRLSERSSRKFQMKLREIGHDQMRRDRRLDGSVIDVVKIDDDRGGLMCASRCESDRACVAAEYGGASSLCQRFSAVNGSKEVPADRQIVETYIKTQQ
jgi:PAN domain-containing protein